MPKKIMICFDGTCNHPSGAKQEREWFGLFGDVEDNGITNVLKLHVLFGGNLRNEIGRNKDQHSFYYSGVGTYGNKIQKIFNAGFAPENLDVRRIIKTAGADLTENYKPDDEIFIFGFSRGAAIARRFAAVIDKYIPVVDGKKPVRFLGVFDTVASIGFPNLDDTSKPVSDVVFETNGVSDHVEEALHLVAMDERRTAFLPTLMQQEDKVTEIWFPGAHADVGGGFWFDGLSDVTLEYMKNKLSKDLGVEILDLEGEEGVQYGGLVAADGSYEIDKDDLLIKPNFKGKSHQQDRFAPIAEMTLSTRDVRVIPDPENPGLPLIHHSIGRRIELLTDYRPRALKGITHSVVEADGSTSGETKRGVWDYIEPLQSVA